MDDVGNNAASTWPMDGSPRRCEKGETTMTRQEYTAPTLKAHGRIEELTHGVSGSTQKAFGSSDGFVLVVPNNPCAPITLKNFSGVC
jgi:hypothetical protein